MNIETNNIEASNINSIESKATRNNRMQPLVAMRALKNLVNDPEKTDQVFVVIKAMSGNALEKAFARFRKTVMGEKILSENRNLLSTLLDRNNLQTYDQEPSRMPTLVSSSENKSLLMAWWKRASWTTKFRIRH